MYKSLTVIRVLIYIVVIFTVINALALIGVGAYFSIEGILGLFNGEMHSESHPVIALLESLDIFLIALVFIIFAIGIAKLFDAKSEEQAESLMPNWLKIKTFMDLKLVLWETILITLIVLFVSDVVIQGSELSWNLLIIPISILILSASMILVKRGKTH